MRIRMTHLAFVYGTLKTGQPNHYLMQDKTSGICIPKGLARTVERFPLVVASRYHVPYMLFEPGKGHGIEGELYEVDDRQLERLDALENHPKLYERCEITVISDTINAETGDSTKHRSVFAYFLVKYRPHLLDLPMYDSYTGGIGGTNYNYVPPAIRDASDMPSPLWWYEVHSEFEPTK